MRSEFPRRVTLAAWDRSGGRCERCGAKLFPGKFHYDHIVPDALGGEPTLENCSVTCIACHGEKTAKRDVPAIAKADRMKAKHLGAKRTSRPMPGSRRSAWKAKIGGGWERRT